MLRDYVAIDLETTGINPGLDSIIEVGMVRVSRGEIIETFHTLVRPEKKIPLRIKKLTGIDDGMVADAPGLHHIKSAMAEFIGDRAILGHSVGFDIGFLESGMGMAIRNPAYDTLDLARILMPSAGSHRLEALCSSAGIKSTAFHRALEDARAAFMLYEHLAKTLNLLVGHTAAQLARLLTKAGSPWGGLLTGFAGTAGDRGVYAPGAFPGAGENDCCRREDSGGWGYADPDRVKELLSVGGLLERSMPSFSCRFQQAEMAVQVAEAMNEKKYLLVEAGTGTGKSIAYLLPAFLWAAGGGPRVVISTGTINLQDQIWNKDIPQLARCTGIKIKAALSKGRSNYICLRKWQAALADGQVSGLEAYFYARVLVWLNQTKTGDRVELNLNYREEEFWFNICADSDSCQGYQCRYFSGLCLVMRARREAESASIIITNHALLLSDIKTGNLVLPAYGPLIIDEAHRLEDAATDQLGRHLSRMEVRRWLNGAGRVLSRCWELVPPWETEAWMESLASLREGIIGLRVVAEGFFQMIRSAVYRENSSNDGDLQNWRVKRESFCGELYGPLWDQYRNFTSEAGSLLDVLRKISGLMQSWSVENDSWGDRLKDVMQIVFTGEELLENLEFNFECPDDSHVYWISVSGQGELSPVTLHSSPVRVGGLLYDRLFTERESVVMTSATLTVNGSFDFFTDRVGIDRVYGSRVIKNSIESPFEYEEQSMLCLVSDLPVQGQDADRQYIEAIGAALRDLAAAVGGRTLALFTSHRVLREVYGFVKEGLEESDICVLGHKIDGNRSRLVEEFKNSGRAVLMGASSFWEGIDIPGEALTCLVIVKLPFPSPSAPVLEARMEDLEMDGRSSFNDYYLPLTVIRFKQGFGRLIRSERDRGVVVVLDRRILEKSYGSCFIGSLPSKDNFRGSFKKVKRKIAEWIDQGKDDNQG